MFCLRKKTLPLLNGYVRLSQVLQHKRIISDKPCDELCEHKRKILDETCDQSNDVIFETVLNKGIITLNRPEANNVLNTAMVKKIQPILADWEKTRTHVIVKGLSEWEKAKTHVKGFAGGRVFCAGAEMVNVKKDFFDFEYRMNYIFGKSAIPYIAIIDGISTGAAAGLAVHGRYRIATERTVFAIPETSFGLFPDAGRTYFLPRLEGKLGLYLALTGHNLRGRDVVKAGIATHYCRGKNLGCLYNNILNMQNLDEIKEDKMLEKWTVNLDEYKFSLGPYLNCINKVFSADSVETILDELAAIGSPWANNTLEIMKKTSPTSMKITKKALDYGAKLELDECLKMEYRIVNGALDAKFSNDFYEGMRAAFVRKDNNPIWDPIDLDKITDEELEFHYFCKLPEDLELKPC